MVFGSIFCFPGVNWAQKWTKTVNFEYILFVLKHLILKDCSHTIFVLQKTTSGKIFNKMEPYLGVKSPRTLPPPTPTPTLKRSHFMDVALPRKHLKIYNLGTRNAILMELNMIMYHHKTFNLAEDWGVTRRA